MIEEDVICEVAICRGLRTRVLGRRVYVYEAVESTNDVAAHLALHGAAEGTLVVAETQTRGRGRSGSVWHSPRSVGVWASLVLRPDIAPGDLGDVTLMMGASIVEAIRVRTGLGAMLKYPNDVLIGAGKVAGILTEARSGESGVVHVVSGFGVNVLQTRDQFPEELQGVATSLYLASGRRHSRVALLQEILAQVEQRYALLQRGAPSIEQASLTR